MEFILTFEFTWHHVYCLHVVQWILFIIVIQRLYSCRYPDFGVTIEFIVSNYLIKQTRKNCDSNATVKVAKEPCLDIKNVDEKWAGRVSEFDIFVFATGGWWEHDLQMRQILDSDRSYRKSRAVMTQALSTVMNYLRKPMFQKKELYWRCSEVIKASFILRFHTSSVKRETTIIIISLIYWSKDWPMLFIPCSTILLRRSKESW